VLCLAFQWFEFGEPVCNVSSTFMRLLLVAPPGAGKGTQAAKLADHYGIANLSSGELLRQEIAADSEIGRKAIEYVRRGDLVPDDLIFQVLAEPLIEAAENGGYVLDGFPRNLQQAQAAYRVARENPSIELQAVVHLDVPLEELVRRLLARGAQEGRIDDAENVVTHRLEVFADATEPLLGFYRERGLVLDIDGNQDVDRVFRAIVQGLDRERRRHQD
jgi:adenylate kinase